MPVAADPVAERLRAGCRALLLLADSVSVSILHSLAVGPLESAELFGRLGNVSRSTYFERLRNLEDLTLICRQRRATVPPVVDCRLTGRGRRLLEVAELLEAWLARAPNGPLELGDPYAMPVLKAMALGWSSTLLRWLAEHPRSLVELEQLVEDFGYRKLERTVHELVEVGLAERMGVRGRLNPYGLTEWAREVVVPVVAAIHWERREIPDRSSPVTATEAEGSLLLARTLIDLPAELDVVAEEGTVDLFASADSTFAESLIVRLHGELQRSISPAWQASGTESTRS
jgi:DNA-binding HxlR family transcriptional regulator